MHAKILFQFCQKIGIQAAIVKEAEALREYHLVVDVPAGDLKRISITDLEALTATLGDAFTLWIGISDGPPLLEIRQGAETTDLPQALRHIGQRDDAFKLRFALEIDKTAIIRQYQLLGNPHHALFYLFNENLIRFLRSPLPRLDDTLFVARCQPTVIVVSDASFHCAGRFLMIVGVDGVERVRAALSPIHRNLRSRVDKYHTTAFDSLSWVGFRLKHLTPLHFLCQRIDGEANGLDSILADHLLHLCILYTANRSSYDDSYFQAFYASSERTTTLTLEAGITVPDGDSLLPRLALWPYSGRETDRLTIFQNVVARELESDDSGENYRSFACQLRHLLDEARWHHRVFLDGQIDQHFEQVQKVVGYVTEVAKEVSQALESVTKTLTDALLATVGVIVLTLLASLVKNETQGVIFKIGMWAYAIYLLLFQGFYRMGSIGHSYVLLRRETDERLATYARKLGKGRVDALASPLTRRTGQFLFWFWLTIAIYLVIIVLIWTLGDSLPRYLIQLGVVGPTARAVQFYITPA
jgi:hypothetical protein